MVFKLDAVDAYERKLVKQIEVAAASVEGGHNKAYVRFIAPVSRGKRVVGAKVELDIATAHGVSRQTVTVSPLDKLEEVTGREIYRDHIIGQDIRDAKG
jgi:type III restriction enzyme